VKANPWEWMSHVYMHGALSLWENQDRCHISTNLISDLQGAWEKTFVERSQVYDIV